MNAELLEEICRFVARYVVLSERQLDAIALWVAHTWAFAAAEATPYLAITSAEKRSGKTRLLEVLELLVRESWLTGRVSAAVLTRKVDRDCPTLLLDESDAAFRGVEEYREALRGLLNTGYRRGGRSSVCVGVGASITFRDFSTFSPKAIAGIGALPDTVSDRSIQIRLQRRGPHEHAERFRRRDAIQQALPLCDGLRKAATPVIQALREARPTLPAELNDRAADCWEPLLAIADLAGGAWPGRARLAAVSLSGDEEVDDSLGIRLLADIRDLFDRAGVQRLARTQLLDDLVVLEDRPWADMKGRPLSSRQLGQYLKAFGIRSRTVRISKAGTAHGFQREQFEDAWRRYLRVNPSHQSHPHTGLPLMQAEAEACATHVTA